MSERLCCWRLSRRPNGTLKLAKNNNEDKMNFSKGILAAAFDWLQSEPGALVVAGASGSLVRWLTLRESWRHGLISLVVGSICALYLGPLVEPMLAPIIGKISKAGDAAGFSAFVVGLGGIGIAGFVIDAMKLFRGQALKKARPDE
jgi:hypothetical protein